MEFKHLALGALFAMAGCDKEGATLPTSDGSETPSTEVATIKPQDSVCDRRALEYAFSKPNEWACLVDNYIVSGIRAPTVDEENYVPCTREEAEAIQARISQQVTDACAAYSATFAVKSAPSANQVHKAYLDCRDEALRTLTSDERVCRLAFSPIQEDFGGDYGACKEGLNPHAIQGRVRALTEECLKKYL